jgi:hypothetical protein
MTTTTNSGSTYSKADIGLALERIQRLKTDPRFCIENLYVVWNQKVRKMVPFRFNEAQLKLHEEINWFKKENLPVRIWICKSRRAGISTGCEGEIYQDTTQFENTNSLIVANQSKPAENILKMCSRFWKYTPEQFRPRLPPEYRGHPPKDRLEFPDLDSNLYVATARSLEQYLGFGFSNMHATEVARYKEGKELFVSLYATLVVDPHSMFFGESTPRGQGNFFHEQCMDAYANAGRRSNTEYGVFRLLFIPWHTMVKSYALPFDTPEQRHVFELGLTQTEKDLLRRFPHISLEQLKWRRAMLAGPPFNKNEELFDQEYPTDLETAFLSSGYSVFARSDLKRLVFNKRQPLWVGEIHWGQSDKKNERERPYDVVRRPAFLTRGEARAAGFAPHDIGGNATCLKVYRWPEKGERIVVAADVAGGEPHAGDPEDRDFSTIQVIVAKDFEPNEQIMVWRGQCNPLLFGEILSALCWALRYRVGDEVTAPLLVAEWNGPGVPCNTYIDRFTLYTNCFRYFNLGVHKQPKTKHIGWESNYKTKKFAVAALQFYVEKEDLEIPDEATILEMSAYRDYGGDEWGGEGVHDDLVSALYIACALIRMNMVGTAPVVPIDMSAYDPLDDRDVEAFDPWDEGGAGDGEDDEGFDDYGVLSGMDVGDQIGNAEDALDELLA